ncbi:hypothetical protein MTO96_036524 [Rhipicephalus appendiculatus]
MVDAVKLKAQTVAALGSTSPLRSVGPDEDSSGGDSEHQRMMYQPTTAAAVKVRRVVLAHGYRDPRHGQRTPMEQQTGPQSAVTASTDRWAFRCRPSTCATERGPGSEKRA